MTATIEQARVAMRDKDRLSEVLDAVDYMLQVYDQWRNDPKAPDVPSQALEESIIAAIDICEHGDIPATCRDLCGIAIPRLRFEWDEYAKGDSRRPDGSPTARFWAVFSAVITARKGAVPYVPKRPEPVKELIRQGVSFEQIGRHIYGYRGKGPFLREDGSNSVNVDLILQEAEKPGSVVSPNWIHPEEMERMREQQQQAEHRITATKAREHNQNESGTTVDRMSIEDFLYQGAAPNVIANVKGVPLGEVLDVQARMQAQGKLGPKPEESAEIKPPPTQQQPAEATDDAKADADAGDYRPPFSAEAFIAEHADAGCGVPDIVAGLKENGVKMTAKQVQQAIKASKVPAAT